MLVSNRTHTHEDHRGDDDVPPLLPFGGWGGERSVVGHFKTVRSLCLRLVKRPSCVPGKRVVVVTVSLFRDDKVDVNGDGDGDSDEPPPAASVASEE